MFFQEFPQMHMFHPASNPARPGILKLSLGIAEFGTVHLSLNNFYSTPDTLSTSLCVLLPFWECSPYAVSASLPFPALLMALALGSCYPSTVYTLTLNTENLLIFYFSHILCDSGGCLFGVCVVGDWSKLLS